MQMQRSEEAEKLSQELGYEKILFQDSNWVLLSGKNKRDILQRINECKQKKKYAVYLAVDEETLRFVLEKTAVDMIIGMEQICPKDSVHHLRGGLDEVLCKIAQENEKAFAFSFCDILHSSNRPQLLGRMKFNLKLARKYGLKIVFGSFAKELLEFRSSQDLEAWSRILSR